MKKEKKLYFEKLRPKMPSVREINQSEDKKLCCSDCVEFWDKVQAQEVYFRQNEIEQKAKELEYDKLQEKLSKEHENDPITIVCAEDKKCMCGHPNGIHNETVNYPKNWRIDNLSFSGCQKCNCSHYTPCGQSSKNSAVNYPTKEQKLRRRYGNTLLQSVLKENIRKSMLIIFNDTDDTFCLESKNNSHEFSKREFYDRQNDIFDFYCVHCKYYKSELYQINTDWELIA